MAGGDAAGARRRRALFSRRTYGDPPARRLSCRQWAVDRGWSAFRRPRRCAHGTRAAGPVDDALRRPRGDEPPAARGAERLRGVRRVRPERAAAIGSATHAAAPPLFGVDRAALG